MTAAAIAVHQRQWHSSKVGLHRQPGSQSMCMTAHTYEQDHHIRSLTRALLQAGSCHAQAQNTAH